MDNINTRYLYTYVRFENKLRRYVVSRETDHYIWIYCGNSEHKISKKKYKIGNGFDATYFYEETDELKKKYENQQFQYKFKKSLESLNECTDIDIMREIIEINNKYIKSGGANLKNRGKL